MYRIGLVVLGCLLLACSGNNDRSSESDTAGDNDLPAAFVRSFKTVTVPYQLSDTTLLKDEQKDTLSSRYISPLLPDSLKELAFGKTTKIKYMPLAKLQEQDRNAYYIVKGSAGGKKAAFLLLFDKEGNYSSAMPFLVPDNKSATSQTSSVDKSFTITKAVSERSGGAVTGEGKEVLAYDPAEKRFTLIMTDLLNNDQGVLINPIDTFPKTHKLAGDYYRNKKNLVAIRDGRYANQILVYIHTENSDGDCKGELKGEFILTSSSTAVYRQGGDPCILALNFSGNTVSLNEERGCGNYRGLDCPLDGKFTRKKEEKQKESTKNANRPNRS
ncbi:MAG TPA: hypothetical protein VGN63_17690 [Flavisolibacter sp.]|jgi:hypothetical protein|nr:hypothetical protein [Flavisolibacter sp.]